MRQRLINSFLAIACGLSGLPVTFVAYAQTAEPIPATAVPSAIEPDVYRVVKRFNFDERPDGNYEDLPMYWKKLTGPGLPFFASGAFDFDIGHDAPPAFKLEIQTGNVAYEYRHLDLIVIPESDYYLDGFVRTQGLQHARAFVTAYFVDRFFEPIAGSERTSNLVSDADAGEDGWTRVRVALPGEFPEAYALRIQFWVLHAYAWREPAADVVDPIVRRDTHGAAWFDDISVYRLPRVRLRFSNAAHLVEPGAAESLILEITNATSRPLRAELKIADADGLLRHSEELAIPGVSSLTEAVSGRSAGEPRASTDLQNAGGPYRGIGAIHVALPDLAVGHYRATLRLFSDEMELLGRSLRFAVLPKLDARERPFPDLGVDLGPWRRGEIRGVRALLNAVGAGAAKIGIPMIGAITRNDRVAYFAQINELVRGLAQDRIETTGVMLTESAAVDPATGMPIAELIEKESGWRRLLAPIFAHFGGLLSSWQVDGDAIDVRSNAEWTADAVGRVRGQLVEFITYPQIVAPLSATNLRDLSANVNAVSIPPTIATRSLPRILAFLIEPRATPTWLYLAQADDPHIARSTQLVDLARRIVLAKALSPQRVYVPAPFEFTSSGGAASWQPTDRFIPVRTLFRYLTGKRAVAAMTPAPGVQAIIFEDPDASCIVLWSWNLPADDPVELYLGTEPTIIDLWGNELPARTERGRTALRVGPMPILVSSKRSPLAALQASFRIAPTNIKLHKIDPAPVLYLRNPFNVRLSGEIELVAPPNWKVEPNKWGFLLEPGQTHERELVFTIPPRSLAAAYELGVDVRLHTPESAKLSFPTKLTVGLPEIEVSAIPYWQSDHLVVEQTLRNLSDAPVRFSAFCQAPGRIRKERAFIDVAPGETARRRYVFEAARDLAGAWLHFGVSEIHGDRRLDQVVQVPN